MNNITYPVVGSIRVTRVIRYFTGTQEMYAKDGVVHAHSALLNGTFTSRDGSITNVYASVFVQADVYNSILAEKSANSVIEVRCLVTNIEDKMSSVGKAYKEAKVDEAGPKKVICTPIEDADDYFGGDTLPIMAKASASPAAAMKV